MYRHKNEKEREREKDDRSENKWQATMTGRSKNFAPGERTDASSY